MRLTVGVIIAALAVALSVNWKETGALERLTICQLKETPSRAEAESVVVRATYTSDGRHFALLIDKACGESRNTLRVGVDDSESSRLLWRKWEAECKSRGDEGLCVFSKRVEVVGRVRVDDDGLFFDISSMSEL